jgi:hypothetical protein
VLSYVPDTGSLSGSVGGVASRPAQRSGRAHRLPTAGASVDHPDLATAPRACRFDRVSRASIRWLLGFEQMQDVLRTPGSPHGQQLVIAIGQRPATADRDQTRVANLGKNHASSLPAMPVVTARIELMVG